MRIILVLTAVATTLGSFPADADTIVLRTEELQNPDVQILVDKPSFSADSKTSVGRARIASAFLGKGSNFWGPNKTLATQCISFTSAAIINAPTAPGTSSADNWVSINELNSLTDYFRSQSFGASVNLTYKIFSLGASGTSSSSNHFTSTSRYIDVDKGVVSDSFFIAEIPGERRLRVMPGIPEDDFTRVCGQSFVWKVSFGSIVSGTIDFENQLSANTSTNGAAISAGITGIISGTANTSKAWSELHQISDITYNIKGGPTKSVKPEDWIPQIKDFGSNPADAQSNDIIIFHTMSYRTVLDGGNKADVNIDALGTLTNLQWALTESIQKLSDRHRVLDKLSHVNESETVIRSDIKALGDYIDSLQRVFKICSEALAPQDVGRCKSEAKQAGLPPNVTSLTFK